MSVAIIILMFVSLLVLIRVVIAYSPNMNERFMFHSYTAIIIYSLVRIIFYLLTYFNVISFQRSSIICSIITISLIVYFIIHIHKSYGYAALKRKVEQDMLNTKGAFGDNSPLPCFIKEYLPEQDMFVMRYVNHAYDREFLKKLGKSKDDYLNSPDSVIWGEKIGNLFELNDRHVMFSREVEDFSEYYGSGYGVFKKWVDKEVFLYGVCVNLNEKEDGKRSN